MRESYTVKQFDSQDNSSASSANLAEEADEMNNFLPNKTLSLRDLAENEENIEADENTNLHGSEKYYVFSEVDPFEA